MRDKGVRIKHDFKFFVVRHDGKTEESDWVKNLLVNNGMSYLAVLQSTTAVSVMNHMNVGTGTTAATLSDIALVGAVGSRVPMASRTVTGANCNILVEVSTFAGFLTGITSATLREIGIFNHAITGGTMRSRAVFSAITLGDSDYLQVNYRTTVGSI
jgi:hypothetical protein